jgi:hypothetical protein
MMGRFGPFFSILFFSSALRAFPRCFCFLGHCRVSSKRPRCFFSNIAYCSPRSLSVAQGAETRTCMQMGPKVVGCVWSVQGWQAGVRSLRVGASVLVLWSWLLVDRTSCGPLVLGLLYHTRTSGHKMMSVSSCNVPSVISYGSLGLRIV